MSVFNSTSFQRRYRMEKVEQGRPRFRLTSSCSFKNRVKSDNAPTATISGFATVLDADTNNLTAAKKCFSWIKISSFSGTCFNSSLKVRTEPVMLDISVKLLASKEEGRLINRKILTSRRASQSYPYTADSCCKVAQDPRVASAETP
jgi:hypothetical protein